MNKRVQKRILLLLIVGIILCMTGCGNGKNINYSKNLKELTSKAPSDKDLKSDLIKLYNPEMLGFKGMPLQEDCKIEKISSTEDYLYSQWTYTYVYEYIMYTAYFDLNYLQGDNGRREPRAELVKEEYNCMPAIFANWKSYYIEDIYLWDAEIDLWPTNDGQIGVTVTCNNDDDYNLEYEGPISPLYGIGGNEENRPIALMVGGICNTHYISIENDGLHYRYADNELPAFKLSSDRDDVIYFGEDEDCINSSIEATKGYLSWMEYEQANSCVKEALFKYPDSKKLIEMYKDVSDYYPVNMSHSYMIQSDFGNERIAPYYEDYYNGYDANGVYYEGAKIYWTSSAYSNKDEIKYNTYLLEGKYVHFTATLATTSIWKDLVNDGSTIFYVLGDDKELFSIYADKKMSPTVIDVDVTNVKELKIGIRGGEYVDLFLGNPKLYKKYSCTEISPEENIITKVYEDISNAQDIATVWNVAFADEMYEPGMNMNTYPEYLGFKKSEYPKSLVDASFGWEVIMGEYGVDKIYLGGYEIYPDPKSANGYYTNFYK